MISPEQVREIFNYDPITGVLTWAKNTGKKRLIGCAAGSVHHGYLRIRVFGSDYYAQRLAWAHYYGVWPSYNIEHADDDGVNNSIVNLRDATQRDNTAKKRKWNNKALPKGVGYRYGRFFAYICPSGEFRHLGTFDTEEEASTAYQVAAVRVYGQFARID